MGKSVYSANETAQIIGKQTVLDIVAKDGAATDTDAIIDARRETGHSLEGQKNRESAGKRRRGESDHQRREWGGNLNADYIDAGSEAVFIALYARSSASAANKRTA